MDAEKNRLQLSLILAIAGVVAAVAAGVVLFVVPRSAGINIAIIAAALLAGGAAYAGHYLAGRAKEVIPPGQAGRKEAEVVGVLGTVGIVLAGWVLLYLLALLGPQTGVHVLVGLGEVVQTLLIILAIAAAIAALTYLVLGVLFKSRHALPFVLLAPAIVGLCLLVVYPMGYEIRLAFSNMSIKFFRETLLFTVDPAAAPALVAELDGGAVSDNLRAQFKDWSSITLDEEARVQVNAAGSYWLIYSADVRYWLRVEEGALNAYKGPFYSLGQAWKNLKEVFTQPILKQANFLPSMRTTSGDLFTLDLALAGDLENKVVSDALRAQFQAQGITLDPEAKVAGAGPYKLGDKTGTYWNISVTGATYKVIRYDDGQSLLVQGPKRYLDPGLFARTILWTAIQVPFHVLGGLVLAMLLNRPMKLRGFYRALLVIPWALPPIVAVLAWRGEFHYEYGFINIMLRGLGLAAVQWKSDPTANFIAMNIVNIWLGIPFMMVILLGGLQSIPSELYEAAEIDGASWWQQFRKITWPLLQPVLTPAIILGVIWTFNNFNVPFFINENELETSDILVTALFRAAFQYNQYGFAAAFAFVIFFILLGFSIFYIRTTGALQGVTESAPVKRRRPTRSLRRGGEK